MKPYYQDSAVTIYHGDCREILPTLDKVDLVLTDPPYGLGDKLLGGNWGRRIGEAAKWDQSPADVSQILSLKVPTIIWGGNYFNLPLTRCWMIWVKRDAVPTVATVDLAWSNFDAPSKFLDCTIASTNSERNGHPTLKPLRLISWCIELASKHCTPSIILDPFMGSGTTLRAAKDLGRKAIGIEIEERYAEIAAKRMSQEVFDFGVHTDANAPTVGKTIQPPIQGGGGYREIGKGRSK